MAENLGTKRKSTEDGDSGAAHRTKHRKRRKTGRAPVLSDVNATALGTNGSAEQPVRIRPVSLPEIEPKAPPGPVDKAQRKAAKKLRKIREKAALKAGLVASGRTDANPEVRVIQGLEKNGPEIEAPTSVVVISDDEEGLPPSAIAIAPDFEQEPSAKTAKIKQKRPFTVIRPESTNTAKDVKQTVSPEAAGRYIDHDPLYVTDSNGDDFVIAATSGQVQVLSVQTSLAVASRNVQVARRIVAFARTSTPYEIDVLDDSGTISTWNWETGNVNEKQSVHPGATGLASLVSTGPEGATTVDGVVVAAHDTGSSITAGSLELYKTKHALTAVTTLPGGCHIVAHSKDCLIIGRRVSPETSLANMTWIEMQVPGKITTVDAMLGQGSGKSKAARLRIAVGLSDGKILLYENVSSLFSNKQDAEQPSPRTMHWHREAVNSVKFSADGNYLISGGKETVLVLWQLETGKKQYLPHLTAEIERIVVSPKGDRYAIQMGDNSIMVLSTSELKPVANYAGLQMMTPQKSTSKGSQVMRMPAAVLHSQHPDHLLLTVPSTQPKSGADVDSRPFLQSFDLANSRHISRQALTRNNVTDFNLGPDETAIIPPDVTGIAISHDGQWLATADDWYPPATDVAHLAGSDEQIDEERLRRRESHLKFWQWDASQQLWTLTTRVDGPHKRSATVLPGAGEVLALVSDPSGKSFASVGEDSCVRIWKSETRVRQTTSTKGKPEVQQETDWYCKGSIELPRQMPRADSAMADFDDETIHDPAKAVLTWSEDGSLLAVCLRYEAVGAAPVVHLIDALTGEMKSSNASLITGTPLSLAFLNRCIIALSSKMLRVWDIVEDKLHYNVDIRGTPDSSLQPLMAVNTDERTFTLFTPAVRLSGDDKKQKKQLRNDGTMRIRVFGLENSDPIGGSIKLDTGLVALLATTGRRGYVLLGEDATVRFLNGQRKGGNGKLEFAGVESQNIKSSERAAPDLAAAVVNGMKDVGEEEGGVEDDRPVIRPEELARVLEEAGSVREMWRGVAALCGRPPLHRATEVNGESTVTVVDAMEIDSDVEDSD